MMRFCVSETPNTTTSVAYDIYKVVKKVIAVASAALEMVRNVDFNNLSVWALMSFTSCIYPERRVTLTP